MEQIEQRRHLGQSVIDYVDEDRRRLLARVGTEDSQRLDDYFQGVRQLETRIQAEELACDTGGNPGMVTDFQEKVNVFYDLMALAFRCDRTRVATMMHYKQDSRLQLRRRECWRRPPLRFALGGRRG